MEKIFFYLFAFCVVTKKNIQKKWHFQIFFPQLIVLILKGDNYLGYYISKLFSLLPPPLSA